MVARKIFHSDIWGQDPTYLKVWLWIIGNANFSNQEKNGYQYHRGELVTTYDEIIKAASHHHNRQHIIPTLKRIRVILKWLKKRGMIYVNPLRPERCRTGADPGAETRAYVGIKITVINYDTYQDSESYKGRDKGRHLSEQGHNNNNDYNNDYNFMSIPFTEIQSKYHELLPELPGIRLWTESRKKTFAARWNSGIQNQDGTPIKTIQYWINLFNYIRDSKHLMGGNDRNWKASIDFIIKESSFLKIIEGQYHK